MDKFRVTQPGSSITAFLSIFLHWWNPTPVVLITKVKQAPRTKGENWQGTCFSEWIYLPGKSYIFDIRLSIVYVHGNIFSRQALHLTKLLYADLEKKRWKSDDTIFGYINCTLRQCCHHNKSRIFQKPCWIIISVSLLWHFFKNENRTE